MRWFVGPVIVAALVVGCGARTELRTSSDAAVPVSLVDGIVLRTCAPNDGPALSFSLGTPVPTCQVPGIATGVIILAWGPPPTGPGTFVVNDAYVCDAENTCAQAAGTLVLTELTEASASGSYTLTTSISTVSASFEGIVVCPNPAMCG